MDNKITSTQIKSILLYTYGFKKGMFVSTELNYNNYFADIICIPKKNPSKIIEIEVKCTSQDILADFINKEEKHKLLETNSYFPNVFYFCVPMSLVEYTKNLLIKFNKSKYGIIGIGCYWKYKNKKQEQLILEDSLSICKPARKLHEITKDTINMYCINMLRRNGNEVIQFYKELAWNTKKNKPILREKKT